MGARRAVLSEAAKRKLFAPQVRVLEPDGGDDWSLATVAEFRRDRIMVFWVSNHAYQKGKWNLEDGQLELTRGVGASVRY
ncbi:hypothetical protein [Streptomyces formicae]|uniref:Uncharacterized protein n=1 Tax=Streptomyces formicae TaxID=1616117 RepID=A0A291QMX4_9ACTN|nr:hypothetical protein [Streptomyces formicae]ATL32856.1 hypothetical protein KY5_7838 [Streptomyces formicae]